MTVAHHVLRYLRGVDADCAGDTDTRRSHTGFVLMFNDGPISWKSRRQDSVALSTSETEYMVPNEGGKEVVYIRDILQDFGFSQQGPTNLYEDNLEAVDMSINPVRRKYSRHVDIHRHYVRELVLTGLIKLIPLGTYDMVPDDLTKRLPTLVLMRHSEVMMGDQRFQSFYARSLREC